MKRFVYPDLRIATHRRSKMKQEPMILNLDMRAAVNKAIKGVCEHRGWQLHALNVRSNHVHVAVNSAAEPEGIVRDFKAYASRELAKCGLIEKGRKVWTHGYGVRRVFDEDDLHGLVRYIIYGQDTKR